MATKILIELIMSDGGQVRYLEILYSFLLFIYKFYTSSRPLKDFLCSRDRPCFGNIKNGASCEWRRLAKLCPTKLIVGPSAPEHWSGRPCDCMRFSTQSIV